MRLKHVLGGKVNNFDVIDVLLLHSCHCYGWKARLLFKVYVCCTHIWNRTITMLKIERESNTFWVFINSFPLKFSIAKHTLFLSYVYIYFNSSLVWSDSVLFFTFCVREYVYSWHFFTILSDQKAKNRFVHRYLRENGNSNRCDFNRPTAQ